MDTYIYWHLTMDTYIYIDIWQWIPIYIDIWWWIAIYIDIWWWIPIYSNIWRWIPIYIDIWWWIAIYIDIWWWISIYSNIWWHTFRCYLRFLNSSAPATIVSYTMIQISHILWTSYIRLYKEYKHTTYNITFNSILVFYMLLLVKSVISNHFQWHTSSKQYFTKGYCLQNYHGGQTWTFSPTHSII